MTVFTGTSGDDSILGTSGGDDFHLEQGGEDSASGGAGVDVFYFGASFDAGDQVDGGADNDFLVLEGDYSAGVALTATTLTGVEAIQLGAGFSYSLSGFTAANISGGKLTIDGTALGAGDDLTIDASGVTEGKVWVNGGAGTNSLTGGDGDDSLDSGDGVLALLRGGKGDDVLIGSASGADVLGGGQGDDSISYGSGGAQVTGGEGDDFVYQTDYGTQSSATVDGGAGSDDLEVGWLGDGASILGGDGDDSIGIYQQAAAGAVVDGGDGVDTLSVTDGSVGSLFISGEQFRNFEALSIRTSSEVVLDDAFAAKNSTMVIDTSDNRPISFDGSAEKNAAFVVKTGDYNDSIVGGGGDDALNGGKGDDVLTGNKGDDTLGGGYNSDRLSGGAGDDVLIGGPTARYTHGVDTLLGGAGNDQLITETSGLLRAGAGNDVIEGVGGDKAYGNGGDDQITIAGNFATLNGGAGDDTLTASGGGETIVGGAGQDIMSGSGVFAYQKATDSLVGAADQIADARGSTIDLHKIDADITQDGDQAFQVVEAFTGHAGELVEAYDSFRGTSMVLGDVDGDGVADFEIDIGSNLDSTTFVL